MLPPEIARAIDEMLDARGVGELDEARDRAINKALSDAGYDPEDERVQAEIRLAVPMLDNMIAMAARHEFERQYPGCLDDDAPLDDPLMREYWEAIYRPPAHPPACPGLPIPTALAPAARLASAGRLGAPAGLRSGQDPGDGDDPDPIGPRPRTYRRRQGAPS